jgi:hypothetical protein
MRLIPGASEPIEIDLEKTKGYRGSVRDGITRYLTDEVHDQDLVEYVRDPDTVFMQTSSEGGETREKNLPLDADWATVMENLRQSDVDIEAAHALTGGAESCRG